ncbi:HAMP domain-containing histidine kinase [Rhizobium tropici]|uniref:histidine kinase n=1 Tax=Rhizobium tropici TaxID=398 RepID=A0A5B0W0J1_RHITR|nr:HAMP domain-containing sensor histidine kinase [Rhizobium tropici]KAA1180098.1 HAMP domain-containing histidine kinase [Rhizobium tropici]
MAISVSNSLNRQIIWSTTIVAFVALSVMFFGFLIYGWVYDWLFKNSGYPDDWAVSDFIVLGINVAIGQAIGAYVGWRLARRLVKPLTAVTEAARLIADGDFAGRATGEGNFGEADRLISDFNRMAEQLQKAEKELQYSNSAIAHELRTPLTILRGRVQGLADGIFEPSQEVFRGLIGHIDALTRIVDDLRTLSLMNAGRMELQQSRFDVGEEIGDIVDSVLPTLASAGIEIDADLQSIVVEADRARIRQAVLALLDNVTRYAPRSQLRLTSQGIEGLCVIMISDNGPGMTTTESERAFERFWRADDARTRRGGGSGLGLAVVRAIAEAHGGHATIDSRKGGGTTVVLTIPHC